MRFHEEALELATRVGLLDLPAVEERIQHLPDWLIELQALGGRTELEQALNVIVPESLWELWNLPSLLCLLDAWGDLAYTSHGLLTGSEAWWWDGIAYLEFAMHGHSGESWVVEASGAEDPPVWHGFLDPEPAPPTGKCLSAFILEQVQTAINQGWQAYEQHRCYKYHVRLVPLPGGAVEEVVEINAYAGQSVRELAVQRFPDRQVLSARRQSRFI